jgi:hypothetical protein
LDNPKNIIRTSILNLIKDKDKPTPAVTIYLPTHRNASPAYKNEDEIRLKNLLYKAEDIFNASTDGRNFLPEFIDKIHQMLITTQPFFEKQTEGLLVCARPGLFNSFRLTIDVEEFISVDDQFHLAPIFGLINDLREYYVLVIAQHRPALYKGDNYGLYATNVELPLSLEAALKIDESGKNNKKQQFSYRGTRGYNGRGGDKDIEANDKLKYWRLIDQTIMDNHQINKKLPLILAGIENEIFDYRELSKYPNILNIHIEGSYGGVNPHELFAKSWIAMQDSISFEHNQLVEEYKELWGSSPGLVSSDLDSILSLASKGRVKKLLLGLMRNTADNIRESNDQLPLISFPSIEVDRTLNKIARAVMDTGGQIFNIDRKDMPVKDSLVLATMRY